MSTSIDQRSNALMPALPWHKHPVLVHAHPRVFQMFLDNHAARERGDGMKAGLGMGAGRDPWIEDQRRLREDRRRLEALLGRKCPQCRRQGGSANGCLSVMAWDPYLLARPQLRCTGGPHTWDNPETAEAEIGATQ